MILSKEYIIQQETVREYWKNKGLTSSFDIEADRDLNTNSLNVIKKFESIERKEIVFSLKGFSSGCLLDAGCGTGHRMINNISLLCRGEYMGIDFSMSMLKRAKRNFSKSNVPHHFCCGNVLHLPFPNESFDRVLSCGVLVYLPFYEHIATALTEFNRVLKLGGLLAIIPGVNKFCCRGIISLIMNVGKTRDQRWSIGLISPFRFRRELQKCGFEIKTIKGFPRPLSRAKFPGSIYNELLLPIKVNFPFLQIDFFQPHVAFIAKKIKNIED